MKELRILHLETVAADSERVREELQTEGLVFSLKRVGTPSDFIRELVEFKPDLVLSDREVPSLDGYFALALAKEKCPLAPFIFVTDTVDEAIVIESLKKGATDHVHKSRLTRLGVAVRRALAEALEVIQLKLAGETLQQQSQLLELANDAIMVLDADQMITYWNKGAELLYGWSKPEAVGKSAHALLKTVFPRPWKEIQEILIRDGHWGGDLPQTRSDGAEIVVALRLTLHKDQSGNPKTTLCIGHDVTGHKMREQQQLQQERVESMSVLASEIAHDFNNVFSVILGYTSLIQGGRSEPEKILRHTEAIQQALRRGTVLARQLLILERKQAEVFAPMDVNHTLQHVARTVEDTFPKSIQCVLRLSPELPAIVADAHHVHEAVLHLCSNAQRAMPKGGKLTISTKTVVGADIRDRFPEARDDHYVRISVADNGIGMDLKTRQRSLEPLFLHKRGRSGHLGLALVYSVVNNHCGFIDVNSRPGKGTTFLMYLPTQPVPGEAPPFHQDQIKEAESPAGNETILVVEDEGPQLDMLKAVLEGKGYKVIPARDGVEAVEAYRAQRPPPDLVLADLGLPKRSGWEMFLELKEIQPGAKVIIASGYLEPSLRAEMMKTGIQDLVGKPYEIQEILEKIRAALGRP